MKPLGKSLGLISTPSAWILFIHVIGLVTCLNAGLLEPTKVLAWAGASVFVLSVIALLSFMCGRLPVFVCGPLVFVYILVIIASWLFQARYHRFLSPIDVEGIPYLFERYTFEVALNYDVILLSTAAVGISFIIARLFMERAKDRGLGTLGLALAGLTLTPILSGANIREADWRRTFPETAFFSALLPCVDSELGSWYQPRPLDPKFKEIKDDRAVIIVLVEALRRDILHARDQQGELYMPFLTALSQNGLEYSEAYSQASDTEMSTVSLITGRYPIQNTFRPHKLPTHHLFSISQRSTAFFSTFEWGNILHKKTGVQYLSDPAADGEAERLRRAIAAERGRAVHSQEIVFLLDEVNVDRFTTWSQNVSGKGVTAMISLYGTHFPYSAEIGMHHTSYYFPPSQKEFMRDEYLKAARRADKMIEQIVTTATARWKDPIIVVTGDHGEEFYEHGGFLHAAALSREVMNVPLLILGLPEHCPKPKDVRWPVGHIDVLPTLVDILGGLPEDTFQGVSLCSGELDRPLFASSRAFRYQDAVMYRHYKATISRDGFESELYNVVDDPFENRDLSESSTLMSTYRKLINNFVAAQRAYYQRKGWDTEAPPQFDRSFLQSVSGQ